MNRFYNNTTTVQKRSATDNDMAMAKKGLVAMLHGTFGRKRHKPQEHNAYCTVYNRDPIIKAEYAQIVKDAEKRKEKPESNLVFRYRRLREMMEKETDKVAMKERVDAYIVQQMADNDRDADLLFPGEETLPKEEQNKRILLRKQQR